MRYILFLLSTTFIAGCATQNMAEKKTIFTQKTDTSLNHASRADYYEQMAVAYSLENQNEEAIENFKLALLHDPKRVSSYIALSNEYRKTGRDHLALLELDTVMQLEPNNFDVLRNVSDLYLSNKLYSKAREIYQKMLQKNEQQDEVWWALFYLNKAEKKYDEALGNLNKISMNMNESNRFKITFEKALIYKLNEEYELYDSNLQEAYNLDPRDQQVVSEYVDNAFAQKKFQNATLALVKFSDTHDYDLEISNKLAFSAMRSGSYEIALREYGIQRTLVNDVEQAGVDLKMARAYYLSDNLKEAEKLYLSVLTHQENDEARFYLSRVYSSKYKFDEAASNLNKIPVVSDYFAEAQSDLALYSNYKGSSDEALSIISEAYAERPDQLVVYQTYSDLLIESKQYEDAMKLLEKGHALFPRDDDLKLKMALVYYRLDNQKSFNEHILPELQASSQESEVYKILADLWTWKEKKSKDVVDDVKRILEFGSNNKNVKPLLAWALLQRTDTSVEGLALFETFHEENPNDPFFTESLAQIYGRSDIKEKARVLAKAAMNTKSNKSNFLFSEKLQQVQVKDYKTESEARVPASVDSK